MADTAGIAALLKALNESPSLGAGLKPTQSVPRSNAFAAAAGITRTAGTTAATGTAAATATTTARPVRAAASLGSTSVKPKTIVADGVSYNARAPRGTYLDVVV